VGFFLFYFKIDRDTTRHIIFCILFGFEMEQRTVKHRTPYSNEMTHGPLGGP